MAPELIYLDRERIKRRGDKPMTVVEKLDELQWLLDSGDHPLHAARKLGTKPGTLAKAAERHGRVGLASKMWCAAKREDVVPPNWRTA